MQIANFVLYLLMRTHNGMRPQDIVVLLKIVIYDSKEWQFKDIAYDLELSASEVSESLNRSQIAGLIKENKRRVFSQNLMEFIEYGLHYVFPQVPGTMVTGIPTAHSQEFFKGKFVSDIDYVWPADEGTIRGLAILPLYKGVTTAVARDKELHKLLAAIDLIRVGKVREKKAALDVLAKAILK